MDGGHHTGERPILSPTGIPLKPSPSRAIWRFESILLTEISVRWLRSCASTVEAAHHDLVYSLYRQPIFATTLTLEARSITPVTDAFLAEN